MTETVQRVIKWGGVVVAVIAVGAGVVFALDRSDVVEVLPEDGILGDSDEGEESDEGVEAESLEGGPPEVLYLRGSTLRVYDVSAHEDRELMELPGAAVVASPRTSSIAYVAVEAPPAPPSPSAQEVPVLHVLEPTTERDIAVGPGTSPLWHHDGTRLAYLRPVDPSRCVDDQCPGEREVVLLDPATMQERGLLDAGDWSLHAWAGDRLLLSEGINPSRTDVVSTMGERSTLDLAASSIWGASPDGRWLITGNKHTEFVPLENGEIAGDPIRIRLRGGELSEGAWSHDSSEVAAVRLSALPEPVVFSPERPRPGPVQEGFFATDPVLWSQEDDAVVAARVINAQRGRYQAEFCVLEGEEGQCERLFSFGMNATLLRVQ